nr:RNA-directed DNA polymerase, eukaryota [Tanacetum cinerariifolium]
AEKGNEPRPSRVHIRADDEPNTQPTRQSSATHEYPSLIDTFFMAHTVNGEFLRDEDRRIYEEMRRLEATGTYTDYEINRLARGGKQRAHIPDVGRVFPARATARPTGVAGVGTTRRVPTIRTTRMRMAMAVVSCVMYGRIQKSNEELAQKISDSIFVTNFPDSVNSRDLWRVCSVYGTVVDVFIPSKKSKAGKRFAFVRFIKVFNLDRLVKNLCTLWIGRYHLFANQVRFDRPHKPSSEKTNFPPLNGSNKNHGLVDKSSGFRQNHGNADSYVSTVNRVSPSVHIGPLISPSPVLIILADERFKDAKLFYLGGKWVMFEFVKVETKTNLMKHDRVNSWFYEIQDVSQDFVSDERVVWVDIEGIPLHAWSRETFTRIGKKWGETLNIEDTFDSSFGRKRLCIITKHPTSILESFKIIVKGRVFMVRAKELFTWNPTFLSNKEKEYMSDDDSVRGENFKEMQPHLSEEEDGEFNTSDVKGVAETIFGDNSDSHVKHNEEIGEQHSDDPFEIYELLKQKKAVQEEVSCNSVGQSEAKKSGSVLAVLVEVIRVGQTMGYSMEGCLGNKTKKEWVKELTTKNKINFIAIQETKTERVSPMDVKFMWGNSNYDYVCSDSLGNSGGILCTWEETVFKKDHVTISDSFVAIYGTWVTNKAMIFIVAIYDPQDPKYRRVLWDYISILLSRWNGEGVISLFPSITALCLDRHLSDHSPIILSEVKLDFGPVPFHLYHSWFSYIGIDDMVKQTWRSFSYFDSNGMIRFKKKLQELKKIMRLWIKDKNTQLSGSKQSISVELSDINKELDQGRVFDSLLFRRHELKCQLNDIKVMEATDSMQKSKVRWAIKWDENSKYFHGIFNKKRSQLVIHGVFHEGNWLTDPSLGNKAFLDHYESRFKKPTTTSLKLKFSFPNRLSYEQAADLETGVSRDEIRLAVWICGENKSPGPDGFTFEFFRKYWECIGPDFCVAIELFLRTAKRQILDGPFILNEVLHWYKRKNKKAFGFGPVWCNWIRGTFCFAKALILVNGTPSSEFQFHCGLKQGDPLSPYLFILIMESLHLSVSRAVNEGLFKGIRLQGSLSLSHLFYADHTLFIVLGVDVRRATVEAMAVSIGCSIMQQKFHYLGVLVGECMSRHKAWDNVVLKLRSRLPKWKAKTLSIGGRLTLLNSRIGDGRNTRFWLDIWKGDKPFYDAFPRIFALELNCQVFVAEKLAALLDICLRRLIASLEDEEITELVLNEYKIATNMTNHFSALAVIAQKPGKARHDALAEFYNQWQNDFMAYAPHFTSKEYTLKTQLLRIEMQGLHEKYNSLKTTITARQSPTSFSELHALLSDHDYMLGKTRTSIAPYGPQAFYGARPSNNKRSNNNNNCRNRNNSRVYNTCTRYGIGHIQSQFPNRDPSTIRTRPSANFANGRAQSSNAFTNWHSDTGANSHVTPDLEAMDNSEAYYGDDVLHVGNGKGLPTSY